MGRLKFDAVLQINDLPVHEVEVPQWGGSIGVRTMRADERAGIEKRFSKTKPSDDPGGFRRAILMATLVNEDGSAFLKDEEAAKQLMMKSAEAVEVLFEKACEINGFRQKDVEVVEKNSKTPQPS